MKYIEVNKIYPNNMPSQKVLIDIHRIRALFPYSHPNRGTVATIYLDGEKEPWDLEEQYGDIKKLLCESERLN